MILDTYDNKDKISRANKESSKEFFAKKCDESKKEDIKQAACPLRELLSRLGDKWSVLLILTLARMPKEKARFSELKRSLPDISQRMLTATLRNLERDGLISREMFAEVPPRVEYQLTELGISILNPMRDIVNWIEGNWTTIITSREVFDQKNLKTKSEMH